LIEYVEEVMFKGLNMRLLTKSAKRMPDKVDTTYEPTIYIYSPAQITVRAGQKDDLPDCYITILLEARLKGGNFEDF
jgi:hypothetical protein